MATITISGKVWTVYESLANADVYFASRPGTTWSTKSHVAGGLCEQSLVTSTRWLNQQKWLGAKTSSVQALAFPRTGLTDVEGTAIDSATIPDIVLWAYYELANAIGDDPTILTNSLGTKKNVKRVKAGPAEVEFFRVLGGTRLPTQVYDWIVGLLESGTTSINGLASGVDGVSSFDGSQDINNFDIVR